MLEFRSPYLVIPGKEDLRRFGTSADGHELPELPKLQLSIPGSGEEPVVAEVRESLIRVGLSHDRTEGSDAEEEGEVSPILTPEAPKLVEPPRVIAFYSELVRAVEDRVQAWFNETDKSTIFVSLDGLSGSGKSTLTASIRGIVSKFEAAVGIYEIGVDDFINTDRNSALRNLKNSDPRVFWELFTSRMSLYAVTKGIASSDGEAFSVDFDRKYVRALGKVIPGSMDVPGGRKIVFIDGVNATSILEALGEGPDHELLKIMLHIAPNESMRRAVNRDVRSGRKRKAVEATRPGEYEHMIPQIAINEWKADIIYRPV